MTLQGWSEMNLKLKEGGRGGAGSGMVAQLVLPVIENKILMLLSTGQKELFCVFNN